LTATKFVFFLSICLALDRVSSREYFLHLRRTLAFTAAMVWSYTKQKFKLISYLGCPNRRITGLARSSVCLLKM